MKLKTYSIKTFGCQMNHSDSERIEGIIKRAGLTKVEKGNESDVIIINSCSIRQRAEDRVTGMGRIIADLRKGNSDLKVILTGCMAKRDWTGTNSLAKKTLVEKSLKRAMPWIDFVVEIEEISKIPKLLGLENSLESETLEEYLSINPSYNSSFQAFVPIATGCDMHCTYCIVPFARGRERDRDAESIFNEVQNLVNNGYKDITLLGQTVNNWRSGKKEYQNRSDSTYKKLVQIGDESKDGIIKTNYSNIKDFSDLLILLDSIKGDWWMSFISPHPNFFDEKLIATLPQLKHLRGSIHLPMQSGNDEILQRMNRKYKLLKYYNIVKEIRDKCPGIAITTDIIVGFPGETRKQFEDTLKAMEELCFDMAYLNEYSPRSGTPSADYMKDDVSRSEKMKRKNELNDILRVTALKSNERLLNSTIRVLIWEYNKDQLLVKSGSMKDIRITNTKNFEKPQSMIGNFANVEITKVTPWGMEGRLV